MGQRRTMPTLPQPTKLTLEKELKVPVKKRKQDLSFKIKKVGIFGYGEVGKAVHGLYRKRKKYKVFLKDLDRNEFPKDLDLLHVCIPYNQDFIELVTQNIHDHAKDALVMIHSTVAVGTTKKIAEHYKFTVHSPVRGVHPNLLKGLKTFIKYVGSEDAGAGRISTEHLEDLGVQAMAVYKSGTTELLKLLDTTYYGLAIAFHDYAAKLCEQLGLNFDVVMTHANNSYNAGYYQLGKPEVLRPILYPPEGPIGGHCVVPNAKILKEIFGEHPLIKAILDLSK